MIEIKTIPSAYKDELFKLMKHLMDHEADQSHFNTSFDLIVNNPHYYLLGAFHEKEKLVGTVMGLLSYDLKSNCRPILFMENMVVHPDYRSYGIRRLLLSELESIAKRKDCFFIQFCSSSHRKDAHRFYEDAMNYDAEMVKGYRKLL